MVLGVVTERGLWGPLRFITAAERAFIGSGALDPDQAGALLSTFHRMEAAVVAVESLSWRLPPCPSLLDRLMHVALEPPRPNGRPHVREESNMRAAPRESRSPHSNSNPGGLGAVPMELQSPQGTGTQGSGHAVSPLEGLRVSQGTEASPVSQKPQISVLRNRSRRSSQDGDASMLGLRERPGRLMPREPGPATGLAAQTSRSSDAWSPRVPQRTSSCSESPAGPIFPTDLDDSTPACGLVCAAVEREAICQLMRLGREESDHNGEHTPDSTEDGEGEPGDAGDQDPSGDIPRFPGWGPPIVSEWLVLCENGGSVDQGTAGAGPCQSTGLLPPHRMYVSTSKHATRMATSIVADS